MFYHDDQPVDEVKKGLQIAMPATSLIFLGAFTIPTLNNIKAYFKSRNILLQLKAHTEVNGTYGSVDKVESQV